MPADLKEKYGKRVPYDIFFLTQQDKIDKYICKVCGFYFSVLALLTEHKKICKRAPTVKKKGNNKTSETTSILDHEQEEASPNCSSQEE